MAVDGLCAIDLKIATHNGIQVDTTSLQAIKIAATRLVQDCVEGQGTGGAITNQGK